MKFSLTIKTYAQNSVILVHGSESVHNGCAYRTTFAQNIGFFVHDTADMHTGCALSEGILYE